MGFLLGGVAGPARLAGSATPRIFFARTRPPEMSARTRAGRKGGRARELPVTHRGDTMKKIQIYCDGSSRGNGQENCRAGAAALLRYGEHMRAVGVYLGPLTNQQAEIVAACIGLEA